MSDDYRTDIDTDAAAKLPAEDPNVAATEDPDPEAKAGEDAEDDLGVQDSIEEIVHSEGELEQSAGTAQAPDTPEQ